MQKFPDEASSSITTGGKTKKIWRKKQICVLKKMVSVSFTTSAPSDGYEREAKLLHSRDILSFRW